MKILRLVLIVAINFFPFWLGAKQVSPETAKQVAVTQVNSHSQLRSAQDLTLAFTKTTAATSSKTSSVLRSSAATDVLYYVFNTGNGFIIVSGDDVAKPVLGYSDTGTYDPNNLPPNFVYFLDDCLAKEIEQAIAQGVTQSDVTKAQWDAYLSGNAATLRAATAVSPILTTQWNQNSPYNDLCYPVSDAPDASYNNHAPTGCAATALAQIMKRWNWPNERTVTIPSYVTTTNKWEIAAIPGTTYAWSSMTDTYNSSSTSDSKTAVATLMLDCGASALMDYVSSGSGATSQNIEFALTNYFQYDQSVSYQQRVNYSDIDWESLLRTEIDNGRPVFYAGYYTNPTTPPTLGGHAFVCDGYDDSGMFHFNWGWGGAFNETYFATTSLNPGMDSGIGAGEGTYNEDQEILINIKPNKGVILNDTTLNLAVNATAQLIKTIIITPYNSIVWSSSDPTIATVDGNGLVTGIAKGTTTVTVTITMNDGTTTYTATCTVNVRDPAAVTLNPESGSVSGNLILNETSTGSGVILPEATPCSSDWTFAGWTKTPITTPTDPMDESTVSAGLIPVGQYVPDEESLSLYGVYTKYENLGTNETQALFADFNNGMPAGWTWTSYLPWLTSSDTPGSGLCIGLIMNNPISTPFIKDPSRMTFYVCNINSFSGTISFSVNIYDINNNVVRTYGPFSTNDVIKTSWSQIPLDFSSLNLSGEYSIQFILNSADAGYNDNLGIDNVTVYANTVNEGNSYTSIISECAPTTLAWQGGSDTQWNNSLNWQNGRIPTPQDTVTIPGAVPNFPDLQASDNASVAEIHFQPGAQIGHQSLLDYGKAFVQYDFSDQVLQRDRWLMLSIPLGQVYPGDFSFGGYPATYMKSFSSTTNGTTTSGSWAAVTHANVEAYSYGDAFVFWLNDDNKNGFPINPDKGLKLLNGIREFPFYQHYAEDVPASELQFYENVDQTHTYSSISKESTFYGFVLSGADYILDNSNSIVVPRDDSKAYQLAKTGTNFTSIQADFTGGVFALIGNPYMATLDFGAFQQENTGIKKNYYIWTGTGYTIFTPDGNVGPTSATVITSMEQFIPPLQGFIVEKQETEGNNIALSFNEDMTTVAQKVALRYSASVENKLNIIASTPVAGFNTFIAKRDGGQEEYGDLDARNIINSITDVPDIYTLKPYKDGLIAVGANFINSDDLLIPVGLATSYAGNITLSFSGMDSYNANISFIDVAANKEIDLTGMTSYDYDVNYTPKTVNDTTVACEDRFFIRISKTITGLNGATVEKTNVFEENGHIQVVSSASNPIKEVEVYNQQGALIYKNSSINAISYSVTRNLPVGAYIVKVISEKNTDNVKVIIK